MKHQWEFAGHRIESMVGRESRDGKGMGIIDVGHAGGATHACSSLACHSFRSPLAFPILERCQLRKVWMLDPHYANPEAQTL